MAEFCDNASTVLSDILLIFVGLLLCTFASIVLFANLASNSQLTRLYMRFTQAEHDDGIVQKLHDDGDGYSGSVNDVELTMPHVGYLPHDNDEKDDEEKDWRALQHEKHI